MKWLPTEVAVEARHAHLLAEAERRRLVRLARRTEDGGPPAGVAPRPIRRALQACLGRRSLAPHA